MTAARNTAPLPGPLGFVAPSIARVPVGLIAAAFGLAIIVLITVILGAVS